MSQFQEEDGFEADLWSAADNLRANSKLTSSDYFMPVLGVIFLRHAANRYDAASAQIKDDQAAGKMPKRKIIDGDYIRRRALPLPEEGHYDWIMKRASAHESAKDLPKLVSNAMKAIEARFEPLKGVLPKGYAIFEPQVLEDLMRVFNSEQIKNATGDVFGRIYEYFLAKFSIQKAHDNGEFFTPASLVQTIVNVIEPDHGDVFDPACGSGGMFVQSSHFIEHEGQDTAKKVVFHGQEKNPETIRIAKMNLAVHGLTGEITEGITYYDRRDDRIGKCSFVMANPPFNVDLVDAEKIKKDSRLPFGLPGVNKEKKVSNGNYLWISYFHSYLNDKGRAGFVMSSQASSAGHGEKEVRRRIVESGDVDAMISIRSNFFYTRTVPCELWFFDRSKPKDLRDKVLMLDARNIYRKVSRKIYDFSPEHLANLSAIVWLHRGQTERFLRLVQNYLAATGREARAVPPALKSFSGSVAAMLTPLDALKTLKLDAVGEFKDAIKVFDKDAEALAKDLAAFAKTPETKVPVSTKFQHARRKGFDPLADRCRGLVKQVDLIYKLAARSVDAATEAFGKLANGEKEKVPFDRRGLSKALKQLDLDRKAAVHQLRRTTYFHKQAAWLLDRFPKGEIEAVPGLVKQVTFKEIENADWSLTPGRYVGVAPVEEDEDFDFEQVITDIHTELADLDKEAIGLAATIQKNFEELI
ncbi:MAG: DNA methyltransferase [Elusimicrobia bacterium CG_4_9_14_3_um_filter_62_55]|nr:MAG: DNA methyltransferase [Elusimicrobia bacterium CG22_combo_CG10-13_8_21_14_all_63_91]PJA18511.1 MAG: DNA methyltransferase [Elusimicrobia bacterium CG_4_10_14_0_2_um_filter_63_34]PJB26690.1 MAG: DNA methyltransferase [Elusimicrobia bacterium CG_4_9_14_3_um_filter_62_55]